MDPAGADAKKKTLNAAEQARLDVAEGRSFWKKAQSYLDPDRLVFLDETGAKTNMVTLYGRAPRSQRCVDTTAHGHWKTQTLLSAIRLGGVIREATVVVDGAMDGEVFTASTESCLAPALRPGDTVVMDNLGSHHRQEVIQAIEDAGASVWYLPPYSPDLNPIEKVWSKVKASLRRAATRTIEALVEAIAQALDEVTDRDCWGYFKRCG